MRLDRHLIKAVCNVESRDAEETRERFKHCAETGLFKHAIRREWQGFDDGFDDLCRSHEMFGYISLDCGLILSLNAHLWGTVFPLIDFATDQQKHRFLPGLLNGQLIGGHAITEPHAGSDIQALSTIAETHAQGFKLNGIKRYITNASIADLLVVYARTGDALSAFIVQKNDNGVQFRDGPAVTGCRSATMGDVVLADCCIPKDRLLGQIGAGANLIQHALELERGFIFAGILGIMEWQLATAITYARERKVGGTALGRNQAISHRIADMKLRLDSARLWINQCAQLRTIGKRITLVSAQTKLFVSEAFLQSSLDTLHILGASGLQHDCQLSQFVQDAMASRLFSGSSEIQRNIIAAICGTGDGYKG